MNHTHVIKWNGFGLYMISNIHTLENGKTKHTYAGLNLINFQE